MNNFELITFPSANELARSVAAAWLRELKAAKQAGQAHLIAISGGRIAQDFFAAIAEQAKNISLERVHFFWADERCVPPNDSESNFRKAQELLFEPLDISESQIHRIRGEYDPELAAEAAEKEIRQIAPINNFGQPVLDVVFLGLGEDGHTASLFPGEPEAISDSPAIYRPIFDSPKPPPQRITLGFPAIAVARQVWMLASGKGKESALQESLAPDGKTPFARVLRLRAKTKIFTDVLSA